ncbi:MAG: UDP-N-acetylglucosamine--N-acetylmuramyl-(pentapeptide) pyrophosphoryl-undecaprenol N-acetylglucosamine transferase [Christensenellaceae bacterium]|jgi:UDP-N-acetylglucosamine--N-acetylmuramyl-(pentapeptide) pyrophosphoryl-undecaprenol N-acetylglucosamine transferase|nr:UDP-N-acetylglucosamine--N-acetylmuramyl-(pentapeptide) pyrophosphoryl-undecaprenol N-acetylglucosamine transferase [Christensenellaceae bacterium]
MKIVLTGGGSGGHVIPSISLLPYIKKAFSKIYYIGGSGIERDILKNYPEVEFFTVHAPKLDRGNLLKNLCLPFGLIKAISVSKKILKQIKPNIVFSKGGFVAVPVCIAAHHLKIPVISHESDITMGLGNKIIYRYCKTMCLSFEGHTKKKCVYTGQPIRAQILCGSAEVGYKMCNIQKGLPILLIIGGSMGAKSLNDVVYQTLDTLCEKYNIIHITGKEKNEEKTHKNYTQFEYVQNIQDLFAISSCVISRAGAGAISEFLALKKPMLLIPLGKNASRGDQIENAKRCEQMGVAHVLPQQELTPKTFFVEIDNLVKNRDKLIKNMPEYEDACKKIYQEIIKCTKN